ncbi:hypothetical protein CVV72_40995 (plasmid) [Amycolatopsis sp. TNS106]|nr:hypothetical protein CVV72_40995 [Amycolatopsis sp. TNS106]
MFDVAHTAVISALSPHNPFANSDNVVRPAVRHRRCLNGHDLEIAGRSSSYDHELYLPTGACELCFTLRLPRWSWLEVDLRFRDEAPTTSAALWLAARPPLVRGGVGQIMLQLWGTTIADLDVQMCGPCRVGVVEQIRVDTEYLRRGIGTVLLAAALVRGRGYRWSTTTIDDTVTARAFWAAQQLPDMTLGEPRRCSDMLAVDGHTV